VIKLRNLKVRYHLKYLPKIQRNSKGLVAKRNPLKNYKTSKKQMKKDKTIKIRLNRKIKNLPNLLKMKKKKP
jgi:hypothetical protein